MTTQILGYSPINTATPSVRYIPSFKTVDLMDETRIQTHKLQRDHKRRLKKMQRHFRKQLPTLYNFSIMNVTEELSGSINGEDIQVPPGIYMADGHTRREDFIQATKKGDLDIVPEQVSVMVYDVNTFKAYRDIYYSFDSADATERTNEKIAGACRALGLNLISTTGKSGSFGSALDIAYPGDRKDDILTKVAYFKDEIIALDSIGLFNPKDGALKSQCLMAVGLEALKIYKLPKDEYARIIGGLTRLANAKTDAQNYDKDYWHGLDCIEYEYFNSTRDKTWIPTGLHRKTSFMSIEPQMDFFWYCIENYMLRAKIDKTRGMKPSNFKGKHNEALKALLAIQPLEGYEFSTDENDDE